MVVAAQMDSFLQLVTHFLMDRDVDQQAPAPGVTVTLYGAIFTHVWVFEYTPREAWG